MATILIIDDDYDICFLLKSYLSRQGYKVLDTLKADRALEILSEVKVDVVLCDYRLGDTDGKTMIRKIKDLQQVPVIIITAYNDSRVAVDTMKMGAFDFVLKPFVQDEILQAVRLALENPHMGYRDNGVSTHHGNGNGKHHNGAHSYALASAPSADLESDSAESVMEEDGKPSKLRSLRLSSIDHEYEMIVKALKQTNFNKTKAAKVLNIDRKTLYNKLALYRELVKNARQEEEGSGR